jgi:hypothetical protein
MGTSEGRELRIVSGKYGALQGAGTIGAKPLGGSLVHAADLDGGYGRKTIRIKIN